VKTIKTAAKRGAKSSSNGVCCESGIKIRRQRSGGNQARKMSSHQRIGVENIEIARQAAASKRRQNVAQNVSMAWRCLYQLGSISAWQLAAAKSAAAESIKGRSGNDRKIKHHQ